MKILVMGAGAVGAYYGAQLQRAGEEVVFCARGDNLRALRETGLEIKSFKGDVKLAVKATQDPHDHAPYDLILFTAHLNAEGVLEKIGGASYVTEVDGFAPTAEAVKYYIGLLDDEYDKDLAAAVLARELGAELFLILTDVDAVYTGWGTDAKRAIDTMTVAEADRLSSEGAFGEGSMGPKVAAATDYVRRTGGRAIITELSKGRAAVQGDGGTEIVP